MEAGDFATIPVDLRVPGTRVEIDNSKANEGRLTPIPQKLLYIGQRLATGTVDAETLTKITSAAKAEEQCGKGSMLAEMIRQGMAVNPYTESWFISLDDDGAGVPADGTIAFGSSESATEAGTLKVKIAGQEVRVAIASGDDQDAIAAAVVAAINANPRLPVSAAVDGVNAYEVDLTCRWDGTTGNDIDIEVDADSVPAGIAEPTITAMQNGATNPTLTNAIAAMGSEHFTVIAFPWTDATSLTAIEAELASRYGGMKMMDCVAIAAHKGTQGEHTTLGNSRNSPHVSILGAGSSPTPPWLIAASLAADEAGLAPERWNRPRTGREIAGMLPPAAGSELTETERNTLLYDGISTYTVTGTGKCLIERMVTTYQTDDLSIPDDSYLGLWTLRTLAGMRYTLRTRLARAYANFRIASDPPQGVPYVAGPEDVEATCIAIYEGEWMQRGWAEGGSVFDTFKTDLNAAIDGGDPSRVNIQLGPNLINPLYIIAAQIQFRL